MTSKTQFRQAVAEGYLQDPAAVDPAEFTHEERENFVLTFLCEAHNGNVDAADAAEAFRVFHSVTPARRIKLMNQVHDYVKEMEE
jgi:hypothetical protein